MQLDNGATIGDFFCAVTSARSFEQDEHAYNLLVAMAALLEEMVAENPDPMFRVAEMDTPEHWVNTLKISFLDLFRQWLSATKFAVPTIGEHGISLEDAFTVLFNVTAMAEPT